MSLKSAVIAGERRSEMKFTKMTGMALAGALLIGSAAPALAQNMTFDPYYVTPKISYSRTMLDDFSSSANVKGVVGPSGSFYGRDTKDSTFGGGLAIGYDFGAYTEYPIRMELEYMIRGNVKGSYSPSPVSNAAGHSVILSGPPNSVMDGWGASNLNMSGKVSAQIQTVMANFYLDFPTDTLFTPYVQAGIGGAYIDAKSNISMYGNTSSSDIDGGGYWTTPPQFDSNGGTWTDHGAGSYAYGVNYRYNGQQSSWNLAWNAGAGFAYQLKDNIALDISYRYSYFGEADFGTRKGILTATRKNPSFDPSSAPGPGNSPNVSSTIGSTSFKNKVTLDAHEVIVGLRITAW